MKFKRIHSSYLNNSLLIDSCHKNPCYNGAKCFQLSQNDVIPKYSLPLWISRGTNGMPEPDESSISPPQWDGRRVAERNQKTRYYPRTSKSRRSEIRLNKASYLPKDSYETNDNNIDVNGDVNPIRTYRKGSYRSSIDTRYFPRLMLKLRPLKKVDYRCECNYGFSGYNCNS